MRPIHGRFHPRLESLEGRLALSAAPAGAAPESVAPAAPAVVQAAAAPAKGHHAHVHASAVNGLGRVFTLDDLKAFSVAYLATKGSGFYNPKYDFNHNGFIGHDDAKFLVQHEQALTKNRELIVAVHLAPADQIPHPYKHTSGGITRHRTVTVIGRTTPGSIVLTDNSSGNYAFNGKALPTNAKGYFTYRVEVKEQLTNTEYLVFDPFGHQTIRAFPILREGPAGS